MTKKSGLLKAIAFCCFTVVSCTYENEESIKVDCSASDLVITAINITAATCATGGGAEIIVTGGRGSFTYLVGDLKQTAPTFSNLPAGSYSIEVTDENGCSITNSFDVTGSDDTITASTEVIPSQCDENNGQIIITATGGDQNFTYSLNGGVFQVENSYTSLASDEYTINVKDENGCTAELTVAVGTDISLTNNIMPIIEANCALSGCHKDTRNPFLTSKEAVLQNANRIAIRTSSSSNPMPPGGSLPQSDIDEIACWVENGALDN